MHCRYQRGNNMSNHNHPLNLKPWISVAHRLDTTLKLFNEYLRLRIRKLKFELGEEKEKNND